MRSRPDLYAPVHKGLRHAMQATLLKLGQIDPSDTADVAEALGLLRDLLSWCEAHLDIEERFVHAAVERKRPAALVGRLRDDHASHGRDFALLRADADALERALAESPAAQQARARQLYLSFSRFVAENLTHMAVEETEMNAILSELFSDDEVRAMLVAIMAQEPPEQLMRGVRWVLPALDHTARAALVADSRPAIDPVVFDHLLGALRSTLSERDFDKLVRSLAA